MTRHVRRQWCAIALAVAICTVTACNSAPPILTVTDLVSILRERGFAFESQEPAPEPKGGRFRFDEGLTLKGQDLWVDVLRIEDQRVFDIAVSAKDILAAAEAFAGREIPGNPEVYTRHPFIVIVRRQPADTDLIAALSEILPPLPS